MATSTSDTAEAPATPRAVALGALGATLRGHTPLVAALQETAAAGALGRRSRAFARQLVTTTLRRLGQIDALLDHCLERPLPRGAVVVTDALRLGVCQLLFLNVPDHAAISESVDLVEAAGHAKLKGLANAILRRLAREGGELASYQDACRFNTPDWLWESWAEAYGDDVCRAIAEAHAGEPPLDISTKGAPEAWAQALEAEALPTGTLRRETAPVEELSGYAAGGWWVQDAGAALPVRLMGDLTGKRVIDLCAAPGGKTAQLAAAGARVTALDRSAARMGTLARNLARLSLHAERVVADAAIWRPGEPADGVLLDAPCSATGTIRRNPDVLWTKTENDLKALVAAQDRLLAAAAEMVKPGGLLVYATCSLQPEEGPGRVEAFLGAGGAGAPFRRHPLDPRELPGLAEAVTAAGDLRTLPYHWAEKGGIDGFYAARLKRVE